ncbi:MAG: hypothetical protein WC537_01390, partial [Candidatus Paceibacterota bacterium]
MLTFLFHVFVAMIAFVVGMIPVSPGIIYLLAKLRMFLAFDAEGKSMGILKGERVLGFLGGLAGFRQLRTRREAKEYNESHQPKVPTKQWGFVPLDPGEDPPEMDLSWVEKKMYQWFGLIWIGFWPFVLPYWYTLRASTMEVDRQSSYSQPKHRNEPSCFVYLKMTLYYSKVIYVVRENVRMQFEYVFYLACRNPYVALFETDDWFNAICARLDAMAILYFGSRNYDEINVIKVSQLDPNNPPVTAIVPADPKDISQMSFEEWMSQVAEGIEKDFGFLLGPSMVINKMAAENDTTAQAFINSFSAEQVAQREGKGRVAKSKADAEAREAEGRGEGSFQKQIGEGKAAGIEATFKARAVGAWLLNGAFGGNLEAMKAVLGAETTLALYDNPNTKVQVVTGEGGGNAEFVRTLAASAQAILGQIADSKQGQPAGATVIAPPVDPAQPTAS